jgi:hypothetical protein
MRTKIRTPSYFREMEVAATPVGDAARLSIRTAWLLIFALSVLLWSMIAVVVWEVV